MKRRPKPKQSEPDPSREVLHQIYRPGGVASNLTTFDRKPRRRLRRWIIIIVIVLGCAAAAAIAGLLTFSRDDETFSGGDVVLAFSGPAQAASEDDYVLKATVTNRGSVELRNIEISVRFPDGFQFVSSEPKPDNELKNAWSLGSVGAGKDETVQITGRLAGSVGSDLLFSGSARYEPANFSSEFVTEASHTVRLTQSALELTITSPHAVTNNQEVTYDIEAKNTSDREVERVRLELTYPTGLADPVTDPKPTSGTRQWDRDKLAPGESFKVTVRGKLSGDPKSQHELSASLGVLDSNSAFLTQREKSALILILEPTLNVRITANDKTAGYPVNSRDTIPLTIRYSNDSDNDVSNAQIRLTYGGTDSSGSAVELVDPKGVTSGVDFTMADGALVWTKQEIAALERIVPGATGSVELTLPLKNGLRSVGSGMNLAVTVTATMTATVGSTGAAAESKSEMLTFPINTEVRLATEGRFYSEEGEQVGSGPLPPRVGTTTTIRISWYVTNTLNGANNMLLSAKLADGATFVSAETTGGNNITYDDGTRTVRWRIDKVDARVGQTLPTLVGTFRVSVTPTDDDVGKVLPLIGSTTLTATDAFTGSQVSATSGGVTTELTNDPAAVGKGKVEAAPPAANTSGAAGNTNTAP